MQTKIIKNPANRFSGAFQLICLIWCIIRIPTYISTAPVTLTFISSNKGNNRMELAKTKLVISELKPVRPPCATPADDSIKLTLGETPIKPLAIPPKASPIKARRLTT